ncbi:beta-ketoacyl-[acyl-carrier-protein] synthase family protein [Blastopirellula sp. JC732]|uniref:Beta-ketoacyl-[acyl-carrier-protein] synthase family protein n=1 Tax=Blastopirellula sediminis TaxID=2894196 RepID=A0A9X1MRT2_9BACT|nr:beta-ketoacyl-[acyl-carrier-protein] synthase family protein [Blastopirellula sediminis]MCC9605014.1 beta-ketoacyl-[acyl-carrier-protein] synthase family protein [Blastopirellula sediminis]MCC9631686.1 beta-ketoacyl-[acyl-carrier-protein] synthase family protein [Blastopirellula sediminis]
MAEVGKRRVVVTGYGCITPFGNTIEALWDGLAAAQNAVAPLKSLPTDALPTSYGAEASAFTGGIEEFGPLDKNQQRSIRKNLKVMCREIQMGVAAAQVALYHAGLAIGKFDAERTGVVYGSDYMMTLPEEYAAAVKKCEADLEARKFDTWASQGMPEINPLWLLKYLPNMPASHIAIFNDMRGPNNSLTLREASSNAAIGESFMTILRGHADVIVTGATGTRVHEMRSVHTVLQEQIATGESAGLCRPFDKNRNGMVLGEGAGSMILETLEHAEARGAKPLAEILGQGMSTVIARNGESNRRQALVNAIRFALEEAQLSAADIGHINAHGLATTDSDKEEAAAIVDVFGDIEKQPPVVAVKSYFGNLGAAGGVVELIASLIAMQKKQLFPVLNYETPDPSCPVNLVRETMPAPSGPVLNLNVTPQGQAAVVIATI